VAAFGKELSKPRGSVRDRVGPGDARDIEAVRCRGFDQRRFDRGRIGQKSRSA
jgi:hypothetical protein